MFLSRTNAYEGGEQGGDDSQNDEIEALAKRLSQEAQRMRSSSSMNLESGDEEGDVDMLSSSSGQSEEWMVVMRKFDPKRAAAFDPVEFELLQELGKISIQQQVGGSNFLAPSEKVSRTAIVAFLAQYFSGMPFEDPVVVFLKEYLPGSQMIACTEIIALNHLCQGIPAIDRRWKVASAFPSKQDIPIVPLLGYFVAGPSGRGADETTPIEQSNTVWVVQKWDGSVPLSMYAQIQQTSGYGLGRLFGAEQAAVNNRKNMIRCIIKGMLEAVSYCHDHAVAHGSLGSGTFLLSTCNDRDWKNLIVKLDSFGFASFGNAPSLNTYGVPRNEMFSSYAAAIRADRRQLAVIILECVLGSFEQGGPSDLSLASSIERILIDVYSWDLDSYRKYIEEENQWILAMEFLDDSLWDVLSFLIDGSMDINSILQHSFFNGVND